MQAASSLWNMGECSFQRGHRLFSFFLLILYLKAPRH